MRRIMKSFLFYDCQDSLQDKESFNPQECEDVRKNRLIFLFTFIFSTYLLAYFFLNLFVLNQKINAVILLFTFFMGVLNFLLFFYGKISRNFASNVIVFFAFFVFSYLFQYGSTENSGIFWMFVFPVLCFFLKGSKKGFFLVILFFVGNFSFYIIFPNAYPFRYTLIAFSAYLLSAGFTFLYEYSLKKYFSLIEKKTEELCVSKKNTEEARELLLKSNQTKDMLFTIIAHDLKNAIGSIQSFIYYILHYKKHEEDLSRYLSISLNAADSTYHLLVNLLEWAKLQTNQIHINPVVFNLSELIYKTMELFTINKTSKKITVRTEIPENSFVYADRNMIEIVFRNLFSNAFKYTPQNGEIIIRVQEKENKVCVEIQDNGNGFPEEILQKINEKVFYPSQPGTEGEKGTGLGLLLCKEFLEKNNASLEIKNKDNQGAFISFCLKKSSSF